MRFKITVIAVLFLLNGRQAAAQNSQYQFSHLDISNGLSHNQVNAIYKDRRGFMWFGTLSGINRYDGDKFRVFKSVSQDSTTLSDDNINDIFDGPGKTMWVQTNNGFNIYNPLTEQFDRQPQVLIRSFGLPDAHINWIKKDSKGNFWFVYEQLGLYCYNEKTQQIQHYYANTTSNKALYSNDISSIGFNKAAKVWIVYQDGTFELLDPDQKSVMYRSGALRNLKQGKRIYYKLSVDNDNDLWIYSAATSMGIYYFNPETNNIRHLDKDTGSSRLKSNIVFNVVQDNRGLIWAATDHGGINLINKKNFSVTWLLNRENDNKSLSQNSTISLYKDDTGIMWAGTYKKGISYYHQNIIRFPLFRHHAGDARSLPFDDVNRFAEDEFGNLWIGTNGGGLIYYNRKTGSNTRYVHETGNPNSLSNDVVVSLFIDHEKKLWIGTFWGGLDCFDGKKFINYKHDDRRAASLSDDRVWEIFEDSDNRLWVGTLSGGLNLLDRNTGTFRHYGPQQKNSVRSPYISEIYEDSQKNIWIGGYLGLDVLQHTSGKFINYTHQPADSGSLVHNNVNSIIEDRRKLMWIGTREGLSIFDPKTKKFTNLRKENGLPDNAVLEVLEDDKGSIWLSTPNGLSNIMATKKNDGYTFLIKNFNETDGLQGREFNENAAYKTRSGELIFGGANGFNLFRPATIHLNRNKINLVLTDLQVFNKSIRPNEQVDNHVILTESITETKSLILSYRENIVSLEFAAINFFNPDKLNYQYILEGFNKNWLNAGNAIRKATFTNLDPGNYTFRVRAVNLESPGNTGELKLKITVLPPFWKTPVAYLLYGLAFFGLLFYIRYRGIQRIKAQFEMDSERNEAQRIRESERQDAQRLHELDLMKIKFLTNVSHEFRTPLSLILSPVDKLLQKAQPADDSSELQIIKRNGRRLLNLVNQLLDFRKLEVDELKLHATTGDIVSFIRDAAASFTDIAESKKIGFIFDSDIERLETRFDHDKVERILFNLLSNAFKFTQAKGHVSVLVSLSSHDEDADPNLEIKVIDTGIGIPAEKLDKVFERFFQDDVPGIILNQGSGIGLSIVKEFVKMHGGEIRVESEVNQGSCFSIELPLPIGLLVNYGDDTEKQPAPEPASQKKKKDQKKPLVLLVEDNEDFRFYLKDNLKEHFQILEGANGKEGWQKALALHPDLMVTDINMPEMSGIELCRKIKNDNRTSHIPVILLTALAGENEQVKGLESGANDYMTKPFNFEILLSKIKNLLTLQHTFKTTYTKHVNVNLPELTVASADEKFINAVIEAIEKNILNPNFSVEELSKIMCMSRVSLYKKLLQLTGRSPVEFIRAFRLDRAIQLFEKSQLNIAEVAYEVGFTTPNYFVKSFKVQFNMLPSQYISEVRERKKAENAEVHL